MSTNFYLRGYRNHEGSSDPSVHIGKRTSMHFTWAMSPERLKDDVRNTLRLCPACGQAFKSRKRCVIEDEYGNLYTLAQLQRMVDRTTEHFESVGERFT